MICPNCEYEYTETVKSCPDCGSSLITAEDFEGNLVHHSDWLVAWNCANNIEAEMMKTNLESAGLESLTPVAGRFNVQPLWINLTSDDLISASSLLLGN